MLAPTRVFQILLASPEHDILLSHPPPRHPDSDRSIAHLDGSYFEEDFQRLLHEISPNTHIGQSGYPNTTCTKRFRAKHTLATEGCLRHIESVFIPYGPCFSLAVILRTVTDSVRLSKARSSLPAFKQRSSSFTRLPTTSSNLSPTPSPFPKVLTPCHPNPNLITTHTLIFL